MKTKIVNSKIIKTEAGIFHRGLETLDHIYFINFDEKKKYTSIKMFSRNREFISDDRFAYNSYKKDIKNRMYTWMSNKLVNN